MKATIGVAFAAVVDWTAEAARKYVVPTHFAVTVQVPEPLVMVTVAPLIEQTPLAVMVAATPEFEVAVTAKLDW